MVQTSPDPDGISSRRCLTRTELLAEHDRADADLAWGQNDFVTAMFAVLSLSSKKHDSPWVSSRLRAKQAGFESGTRATAKASARHPAEPGDGDPRCQRSRAVRRRRRERLSCVVAAGAGAPGTAVGIA